MSLFFKKSNSKVIISYFFLEVMGRFAEENPSASFAEAIAAAVTACGQSITDFTEAEAEQIAYEILDIQKSDTDKNKKAEEGERQDNKPYVGTDFLNTVGQLPMDMKCLYATQFDFQRARHLYCHTSKQDCDTIVTSALEVKWKELKTIFESVIVGMGGSLSDDDGVDLTTGDGAAELKSLGF